MGGHTGSDLTNSPADHFLNIRAKSNSAVPNRTVHIVHSTFYAQCGRVPQCAFNWRNISLFIFIWWHKDRA